MEKENETRAFLTNLYLAHFKSLWGYAYHLTGDKHAADDIVQTVFVQIIKHTPKLMQIGDGATIKAYLNAAVRNTCYNHTKKAARHNPVSFHEIEVMESGFSLEDLVITREALADIFRHLTPLEWDLLTLFYYVGLSYKEISEVTGLSRYGIGSALYRIRVAVKSHFEYGWSDGKRKENG